ncbi:MAG: sugar ABC transporter permease, partial [Acidobacteria bacterium]|nr:sugar ABC transporter permease [Acidobacteriota bacterium]
MAQSLDKDTLARAAVGAPGPQRGTLGRRVRNTLTAYGFLAPAMGLVLFFFLIPGILLLVLSLTDLSSANFSDPWTYIGLDNFERLFSDPFFPKILRNTVFYVFTTLIFFNLGLALVLALVTTNIPRRSGFFFRLIWLLPRLTPSVVYILMWKRIGQADPFGIYNQLFPEFLGASGGNLFLGG